MRCQPSTSMKPPMSGAMMPVPIPPAPQRIPTATPRRRRNHPLTADIRGTMARDWVSDSNTPKKMKKCQTSVTCPSRNMLIRYMMAAANSIQREP